MSENLRYEDMLAEIQAQPKNLSGLFETTDHMIRDVLTPKQILSLHRVFLTGCGDSHHASLCAEMAFESIAGLPCEPMTTMQMARYARTTSHPPSPTTRWWWASASADPWPAQPRLSPRPANGARWCWD